MKPGHVLIKTKRSLVSLGTERMLVEFGRANLLQKARSQPEKVKQVLDKIRTDGLMPTIDAVKSKSDQPIPLGFCNVGRIIQGLRDSGIQELRSADYADYTDHGKGRHKQDGSSSYPLPFFPSGFSIGDRVVSNGPHAEVVCVPRNLCMKVLDGVSDETAVFTVLGAIGLEGIRLAQTTLGDAFVVICLALVGMMTLQVFPRST